MGGLEVVLGEEGDGVLDGGGGGIWGCISWGIWRVYYVGKMRCTRWERWDFEGCIRWGRKGQYRESVWSLLLKVTHYNDYCSSNNYPLLEPEQHLSMAEPLSITLSIFS